MNIFRTMKRTRMSLGLFGLGVVLIFSGGCGRPAPFDDPEMPRPGTMIVLSVDPVERARRAAPKDSNLLEGGDFASWWVGASAPQGVFPPDERLSRLEKTDTGMRQTWNAPDTYEELAARTRMQVPNLTPGEYEVEVVARGPAGATVSMGLWLEQPDGAVEIDDDFIQLTASAERVKRFSRRFTLGTGGTLLLTAHAGLGAAPGAEIWWHQWRVTRMGGG